MFTLDNNDITPLYRQLYQQIRDQVLSGELPAHSRLPSIRDLAAELEISRNTVEGAFQELCAEGYLYSKSRSGYFVSSIDRELAATAHGGFSAHRTFIPGWRNDIATTFIPHCSTRIFSLRRSGANASSRGLVPMPGAFSQYGEPQGEWGLRCNLQYYLERSRGVHCSPDQIVICSGLQQGLDVVAQLIRGRHSSVAVENPGYHLPRELFRNQGFTVVTHRYRPRRTRPART